MKPGRMLVIALLLGAGCSDKTAPSADLTLAPPDGRAADRTAADRTAADRSTSDRGAPDLGLPWPTPTPATLALDGQLVVDGTIDGRAAVLALDTGAAPTAIDTQFGAGLFTKVDLAFGPITAKQQQVAVTNLAEASAFVGVDLGGLVGSDVLGRIWVGLDYHTPAAYLLTSAPPASLPPGGTGPALECLFKEVLGIPIVDGMARGAGGAAAATVTLIADTGSGVTLLTQSLFDAIDPKATLPRLKGYVWRTSSGATSGFVTRIPSLLVGGAEAKGAWAVVVPDNHHLALTLTLVGLPTSFLGYSFYRSFLTVYAGPEKRYRFYPVGAGPWAGEWRRVGVELAKRPEGFRVEMVYEPSSALAMGVKVGDVLESVDGQPLHGLTLKQVVDKLCGVPKTSLGLGLVRAGVKQLLVVEIDDLLPPL